MKVFITGGGDHEDFRDLNRYYLSFFEKDVSSLLLLPAANEDDEYEETYERIEDLFSNHFSIIEMQTNFSKITAEYLSEFDTLYIDGGNTFTLIDRLRKFNLAPLLKPYLHSNKIIHADSAGGIVLGSHIQTAFIGDEADENREKMQKFHALDLLNNWAVHAHYQVEEYEILKDMVFDYSAPIMALSEETGVVLDLETGEGRVFGKEPLTLFGFEGVKKVGVGDTFGS